MHYANIDMHIIFMEFANICRQPLYKRQHIVVVINITT